jgi:hypothetical protein
MPVSVPIFAAAVHAWRGNGCVVEGLPRRRWRLTFTPAFAAAAAAFNPSSSSSSSSSESCCRRSPAIAAAKDGVGEVAQLCRLEAGGSVHLGHEALRGGV